MIFQSSNVFNVRYFDVILKESPDSVEDVIVEADGEWHSSDNKYGSARWRAAHPPLVPKQNPSSPRKPLLSPEKSQSQLNGTSSGDQNGKRKANVEILVLDSDDEDDEGQVKRELSPSFGSGSSAINRSAGSASLPAITQSQGDVIDLTIDSDEEDALPQPSRTAEKRKATDNGLPSPTEQIWKKSRVDAPPPPPLRTVNGHANGTGGSSSPSSAISASAHSAMHMPAHYDPLREATQRAPSVLFNRPQIPRIPSAAPRYPGSEPHYSVFRGSDSPTPPPPRPRHLNGGRDFASFSGSSVHRWS